MRNIKTIEADISKLQAELADVKDHESMRDSAVHILKNLGWTRIRGQWVKTNIANINVFDKDTMTHIKEGDFVQSSLTSDILYVRKVNSPSDIECSRVIKIQPGGTSVSSGIVHRQAENLKVVDPMAHMGYAQL